MGAIAIRGSDCVYEQHLSGFVHFCCFDERGMKREAGVELCRFAYLGGNRAAQLGVFGFGIRRHDMQAICGAALDNENEAPVGFRRSECDLWMNSAPPEEAVSARNRRRVIIVTSSETPVKPAITPTRLGG